MPDPMILNDLAGEAILEGKHAEAAEILAFAAGYVNTESAKRVLMERAKEEAKAAWAWEERYAQIAESR